MKYDTDAEIQALKETIDSLQRTIDCHNASMASQNGEWYRKQFCREVVSRHPGYVLEPDGKGGYEATPLTPRQLWVEARDRWLSKPEDM